MEEPNTNGDGVIDSGLRGRLRQPDVQPLRAEGFAPEARPVAPVPVVLQPAPTTRPQLTGAQPQPVAPPPKPVLPVLTPIPVAKLDTAPALVLPKIAREPMPVQVAPPEAEQLPIDEPVYTPMAEQAPLGQSEPEQIAPVIQMPAPPPDPALLQLQQEQLQQQAPAQPQASFAASTSFSRPKRISKFPVVLSGVALLFVVIGLGASVQTMVSNHEAAAQVALLSAKVASTSATSTKPIGAALETTKPSDKTFSQYIVASDLAKYLKIPKLGVNARVLQSGVKSNGSLTPPANIYDTTWYMGSAKPGQAGATLIDGYISNGTTPGALYGLASLTSGDTIQLVRGDNSVVEYKVVKALSYAADKVDMQAAITPVTSGKPGLNIITSADPTASATEPAGQRIIVFTEQL